MRYHCILLFLSLADGFTTPGSLHARARADTPRGIAHRNDRAAAGLVVVCQATGSAGAAVDASGPASLRSVFSCPQCRTPTALETSSCSNCGAPFTKNVDGVTDLTPQATAPKKTATNTLESNPLISSVLSQVAASTGLYITGRPLRQELFRSPFISFLYERGWRNAFKQSGFPGIEKEYEMVMEFFKEAYGKTVIDLSCGSGLMVRRLARSTKFGKVIAVDYSESMLQEVVRRSKEEKTPAFDLLRADVQCMPFQDDCIDAIHSGAALHCWPSVQDGLKEVHRVLTPGGRFFATTFLWGLPDEVVTLRENLSSRSGRRPYRFFSPAELEWLMKSAGFSEVNVEVRDRCALIRCKK